MRPASPKEFATRIAVEINCAIDDDSVNSQCWDEWDQRFSQMPAIEAPVITPSPPKPLRAGGSSSVSHALPQRPTRMHRSPLRDLAKATAERLARAATPNVSAISRRSAGSPNGIHRPRTALPVPQKTWHEISSKSLTVGEGTSAPCAERCRLLQHMLRPSETSVKERAASGPGDWEWDLVPESVDMLWEASLHSCGVDNDLNELYSKIEQRSRALDQDVREMAHGATADIGSLAKGFTHKEASIIEGKSPGHKQGPTEKEEIRETDKSFIGLRTWDNHRQRRTRLQSKPVCDSVSVIVCVCVCVYL